VPVLVVGVEPLLAVGVEPVPVVAAPALVAPACVDPPQLASARAERIAALKALYLVVDNPGKRSGCQMHSQVAYRRARTRKPVEYDALRRRLWIFGQRCHHGAAGTIAALCACAGLVAEPSHAARPAVVALAAGGVLMLHDWKDRSIWFERGYGSQP
jgi:hypothetical protein